MSRIAVLLPLLASALQAAQITIPLTGTGASEANGNGHAFVIPDLDGLSVNPNGSVNYNPLTYPPPPFNPTLATPTNQLPAPGPHEVFDIGDITYNSAAITGAGLEYAPPASLGILLDFEIYSDASGYELDVRPPTLPSQIVTLTNFAGPGLRFENGAPVRLDFTANIAFQPTYRNTQGQHSILTTQPYRGRLVVVNGTFTFDLADNSVNYFIGATDVHLEFDLIATIPALRQVETAPTLPTLVIGRTPENQVRLDIGFPVSASGRFVLESAGDLSEAVWTVEGAPFTPATVTSPLVLPVAGDRRFYRVRTADSP